MSPSLAPVFRVVLAVGICVVGDAVLYAQAPKKGAQPAPAAAAAFSLDGFDANAPTFLHMPPIPGAMAPKAKLPIPVPPGVHPRLVMSAAEIAEFKATLQKSEKGQASMKTFFLLANGASRSTPQFPTPQATAADQAGKQHGTLANHVQTLGFAYALTGDQKYAQAAREILVGYAQRYASYPRHSGRNKNDAAKVTFQRLSESMWLIPQLEGYDYIYSSGVLSDADKKAIDDNLIRPCILEIRRKAPAAEAAERDKKSPGWREKSPPPAAVGKYPNWINYYSTATMMAGAVMGEQAMVDLAAADFRSALANGIGADGMWGEGAINYQLFAMGTMSPGFEAAAHQGIDLWGAVGGRFKQLFDSPLRYAYPDGTMPGINDSSRGKLGSTGTLVYDYGMLRYGDPQYASVVNDSPRQLHTSEGIYQPARYFEQLPEPPPLKLGSTVFDSLGFSIFRDETKYALIHYGPHGGTHGHYDKLNLVLYGSAPGAAGDELGGEPVFHKYADALHPEWTKQTVAHNTMTVDETEQAAGEGKLLVFEDSPELKAMRTEASQVYNGALLDRTVVVTRELVIDLFTGTSATPRTWDRTFRFRGPLNGLVGATPGAALGAKDGYQHLKVAKREPTPLGWRGEWETKPGKFFAALAGAPTEEIILAVGPDQDQIALARQKGERASFAAAYQLKEWGNAVATIKLLPESKGVAGCEVLQEGGTRTVVIAGPGKPWEAGGWKSDCRVLVVQESKAGTRLLLGGGTFAEGAKGKVTLPAAGNGIAEGTPLKVVSSWKP